MIKDYEIEYDNAVCSAFKALSKAKDFDSCAEILRKWPRLEQFEKNSMRISSEQNVDENASTANVDNRGENNG